MGFHVIICFLTILLLISDHDVTTSVIKRLKRQTRDGEIPSDAVLTQDNNNETSQTGNVFVQRYDPKLHGDDGFKPYLCKEDKDCWHEGRCMDTSYGGCLCNCTLSWLGPRCEFSSASMELELRLRPLVRSTFLDCLNRTGISDGVHALIVYKTCRGGNTECWLNEGGSGAIKVLYWCLSISYKMLITEGRSQGYDDRNLSTEQLAQHETLLQHAILRLSQAARPDALRLGIGNGSGISQRTSRLSEFDRFRPASIFPILRDRGWYQGNNRSTGFYLQPSRNRSELPPSGRNLASLFQEAQTNGGVSQNVWFQLFGERIDVRKTVGNQHKNIQDSLTDPDYFSAPAVY